MAGRFRRSTALTSVIAVALVVAGSAAPARAQRPYEAAEGFLVRAAVPLDTARTACLTSLLLSTVAPEDVLSCEVTEVVTMDTADAWWWTMARYLRRAVERGDDFVDTVAFDEVVLLATRPSRGIALPVWHMIRDRSIEVIDGVRWARKRRGLVLAVDLCLNGTGGCYSQMLEEYAGDHWAVVDQAYLDELARRAPEGYTLHKGGHLDLETLTGEQPIATRDDANCCPSGLIRFSVWLNGRHLRLVRAEVTKPED
jgi:hypothetical protein